MSETFPLPPRLIDAHNHLWKGTDPAALLARLDALNIETMVLLGLPDSDAGNDKVQAACRQYPGRFVGGCYLDPREGAKALEEMRRWHGEGMRIVKLFPNFGYYPDDDALRPFFDAVAELKMAVLSHCGWLMPLADVAFATYYAMPVRFEKLIRLYRDTPFVLAHLGGIPGFLETIMLTTRTPNTYADITPGQGTWVLECAGAMAASLPPGKLLWGVDSERIEEVRQRHVAALEKLGFGPHFAKIFHDNAHALLTRIGAL